MISNYIMPIDKHLDEIDWVIFPTICWRLSLLFEYFVMIFFFFNIHIRKVAHINSNHYMIIKYIIDAFAIWIFDYILFVNATGSMNTLHQYIQYLVGTYKLGIVFSNSALSFYEN